MFRRLTGGSVQILIMHELVTHRLTMQRLAMQKLVMLQFFFNRVFDLQLYKINILLYPCIIMSKGVPDSV